MTTLPISALRDAILDAWNASPYLVLTAPTGTGKSTRVPQFLLDSGTVEGEILVLQPRRLAARMLAARVADERDLPLGEEIGYQTRLDSRVSERTRVRFITDGLLPRFFLSNPTLAGIGAVLFDEFHERSLSSDVGLALVKRLQAERRSDLKVGVMSATLDAGTVASYLGECPVITLAGRAFPVDTRYRPASKRVVPVWDSAIDALAALLREESDGDVLVFMPGAYEIRRTMDAGRRLRTAQKLLFLPLYGDLPAFRQAEVMEGSDRRKVIVATNIAETSLTIPGVRHVIDSGLARISRYDPSRGLTTLFVEPISRHSAEQRAGRAGREGPGTCTRLWSQGEQAQRPTQTAPEIQRCDMAQTVLHMGCYGLDDDSALDWFEPPTAEAVDRARALLTELGALARGRAGLTDLGREMAELPVHPRVARFLIEVNRRGGLGQACLMAAILGERPVTLGGPDGLKKLKAAFPNVLPSASPEPSRPEAGSGEGGAGFASDLFLIMNALHAAREARFDPASCTRWGLAANGARAVWQAAEYFRGVCKRRGMDVHSECGGGAELLKSLLVAYPDHLAHRRDAGSLACELRNGRRGELTRYSSLRRAELFIAGEIREVGGGGRPVKTVLSMNSETRGEWLDQLFPDAWEFVDELAWHEVRREVNRIETTRCLGVLLEQKVSHDVDQPRAGAMLAEQVMKRELPLRGWSKEVREWIQRARWVAALFPDRELPVYSEDDRELIMRELCAGERRYDGVKKKECLPFVRNVLSWEEQRFVEDMAPTRTDLPNGHRLHVRYEPGRPARGRARIQDLYGLKDSPSVAGGHQRVLLEILAPNMRAVQVTDDLAGFWQNLYPSVKRELAKRYPKHEWR